jgi:hypothetical protein
MKPRTKLQAQVYSLSQSLPKFTLKQEEWAFKHCLQHIGYRTKKNLSCLDCGHVWAAIPKVKTCVCPYCKTKLIIEDTKRKKYSQYATIGLVSVVEDFQVNRFFEIWSHHAVGKQPTQLLNASVEQWFKPSDKLTIIARSSSFGRFCFSSEMEIKPNIESYWNSNKYDLYIDKILPGAKCLPIYKRNGFTSKIEYVPLYSFFNKILHDSIGETLLKAGQYQLLSARMGSRSDAVRKYWDSIKICVRNKYVVKDAVSYLDYLGLLQQYGKDLRNPKYVCPSNFKREHNLLVAKRAKAQRIRQEEQNRRNAELNRIAAEKRKLTDAQDAHRYLEEKAPYFGLVFKSGELIIKVLESVDAFKAESDALKHCVYTNRYYNMEDSLCFSATVAGVQTETIEVSISKLKVVQARGLNNQASKFNKEIVDLVNKNMHQINKRRSQCRKEAA